MTVSSQVTPERIEKIRKSLDESPGLAETLNVIFWEALAANVAALPDDQRTQGEDALQTLGMLLGADDEQSASYLDDGDEAGDDVEPHG